MINRANQIVAAALNRRKKYGLHQTWISARAGQYVSLQTRMIYNIEIYKDKAELRDILQHNIIIASRRLDPQSRRYWILIDHINSLKKAYKL